MKTLVCLLLLLPSVASAVEPLSKAEQHRLGAYLVFIVVTHKPDDAPAPAPKPGDTCPECLGVGKVGDGVTMLKCGACNGTGKVQAAQTYGEAAADILDLSLRDWNWSGVGNPSIAVKRRHLIDEHGIDAASVNKMSNAELEATHNLLHDSEVRAAAPATSSSCPSGNCPSSSSSSSSTRRYGIFRRR